LQIPNGLGVLFAVAQVVLYAIYYKSSTQEILEARKRKADQVAMTEV
jgi:solute carrier family 50 (sugar transporter)